MRLPVTRIGAGASRIGHAPGPLETSAEHCPSGDPRQVPTGSRPPFPALGFWPIHPGPRRVSNSLDAGLINLSLRPFECQDRAIDPSGLDKPFCPKSQDRLASRVDFIAAEKTARSSNRRPSQGLSLAVCTRPGRGKTAVWRPRRLPKRRPFSRAKCASKSVSECLSRSTFRGANPRRCATQASGWVRRPAAPERRKIIIRHAEERRIASLTNRMARSVGTTARLPGLGRGASVAVLCGAI